MRCLTVVVLAAAALVAGCSSSNPSQENKYQGREETRKLEGASAAGYDGTAVRRSVDSTLNNNYAHNREVDSAAKGAEGSEPAPGQK